MTTHTEDYKYDWCGLPDVTLRSVTIDRCLRCGEEEVSIPSVESLHRVLAHAVASKPSRLSPPEVRFLRKYLGLSGINFARRLGVTQESVSRWENGHEQMTAPTEKLIRLLVEFSHPVADYSVEALDNISANVGQLQLLAESRQGAWMTSTTGSGTSI
jgi:putative zinc finger/helix-turn-helix YgiT family protein